MICKLFQVVISVMFLLAGSLQIVTAEEKKQYSMGIVPQYEIRHLRKIWLPIFEEVEKLSGIKLKLLGSPTIPDFENEFEKGSYDFAFMNPYHALIANQTQGYRPILRDVGNSLQGILVTKKDSGIKSIHDLNHKKIAFPAPNALGASLLMRAELATRFNLNIIPIYVKTHSSVYLNVIVNQTSAGGGVQKTLNQQSKQIQDELVIIHRTEKVPPHPFVAHPRVPAEDQRKLQQALLQLGSTPVGAALLSKIPVKKIGAASLEDYLPLQKMNLDRFYVK